MLRGLVLTAAGAAVAAAALSGCSSDNAQSSATSTGSQTSSATETTSSAAAAPDSGTGTSEVIIDGQSQQVAGSVNCTVINGNTEIVVGDASGQGLQVSVTTADPPTVNRVIYGSIGALGGLTFNAGGGGNAEVEVNDKTYTIKGNATSASLSQGVGTKPFEVSVTCP